MSKKLLLKTGQFALVDDEDYPILIRLKWSFVKKGIGGTLPYVVTYETVITGRKDHLKMHDLIMGTPKNKHVYHINKDPLDNRKKNLVILNQSEFNAAMPPNSKNTSGLKGVSWNRRKNKWEVYISINNKHTFLANTSDLVEAAKIYNNAAMHYHGEYAYLNDINQIRKWDLLEPKLQRAIKYKEMKLKRKNKISKLLYSD